MSRRLLLLGLALGIAGSFAGYGVWGLFSATTQNAGNEVSAGTVALGDNDSGSALYEVNGVKPGETVTRCIKTSYSGSLPAAVRLYGAGTPGPLAPYVDLTITQGTQASPAFPSCTGFAPDSTGVIYAGTLQSFEQTRTGYAAGVPTVPAGQTSWGPGTSLVYRVEATLQAAAPDSSQGWSTGTHTFLWEARNQ